MNTNVTTKKDLFQPITFRNTILKNRAVMAPMTRSRAIGTLPNELMAKYYAQRASAGLIITEGTSPSPNGIGYARTPGIYSQEQINGWRKITDAVHKEGGKIFIQLMHVGRIGHPENGVAGARLVAPSAVGAPGQMWTDSLGNQPIPVPQELTTLEVKETIAEFIQAAKNAIEAGFDGIEIHGANGYLVEQFLNPHTNIRTDEYGGSAENRNRFLIEIAKGTAEAIGKEKVGVRLSPYGTFNDMPTYDDVNESYEHLVEALNELDILYLHIVRFEALAAPEGPKLLKNIRNTFQNLLILAGGYDRKTAEEELENENADLISFGRPYISNPDLVARMKEEVPLTEPITDLFYASGAEGFVDYPTFQVLEQNQN